LRSGSHGLSLPGYGNVCHREIEYFGMGVVALMPPLRNSFRDPLLPNVHYLAADVRLTRTNHAAVADAVRATYERYRCDVGFLNYVRDNARRWYEKNVWLPNACRGPPNCLVWMASGGVSPMP